MHGHWRLFVIFERLEVFMDKKINQWIYFWLSKLHVSLREFFFWF